MNSEPNEGVSESTRFCTAPPPAFVMTILYVRASPTVPSVVFTVFDKVIFGAEAGIRTIFELELPDRFRPLGS
ncbi:hypothetical protein D3C75_1354100 [compost metagenome]